MIKSIFNQINKYSEVIELFSDLINKNNPIDIDFGGYSDNDSVGASLSLFLYLKRFNCNVRLLNWKNQRFKFAKEIKENEEEESKEYPGERVLIVLDSLFTSFEAHNNNLENKYKRIIILDHHEICDEDEKILKDDKTKYFYLETNSMCDFLFELFRMDVLKESPEICKLLLCGIIFDNVRGMIPGIGPEYYERCAILSRIAGIEAIDEINKISGISFAKKKKLLEIWNNPTIKIFRGVLYCSLSFQEVKYNFKYKVPTKSFFYEAIQIKGIRAAVLLRCITQYGNIAISVRLFRPNPKFTAFMNSIRETNNVINIYGHKNAFSIHIPRTHWFDKEEGLTPLAKEFLRILRSKDSEDLEICEDDAD